MSAEEYYSGLSEAIIAGEVEKALESVKNGLAEGVAPLDLINRGIVVAADRLGGLLTTVSFVMSLSPLVVLAASVRWLTERPARLQTVGVIVALAGGGLFFSPGWEMETRWRRASWPPAWLPFPPSG